MLSLLNCDKEKREIYKTFSPEHGIHYWINGGKTERQQEQVAQGQGRRVIAAGRWGCTPSSKILSARTSSSLKCCARDPHRILLTTQNSLSSCCFWFSFFNIYFLSVNKQFTVRACVRLHANERVLTRAGSRTGRPGAHSPPACPDLLRKEII